MQYLNRIRDYAMLPLRLAIGAIFLAHGWPKLMRLLSPGEGPGLAGYLMSLGIPAPELMAWVVALSEVIGGVALVVGVLTRLAAIPLIIDMIVIILVAKRTAPFVQSFDQPGTGTELDYLILGGLLTLLLSGPGKPAIDWLMGWDRGGS
jgi:putative oxidoreductase